MNQRNAGTWWVENLLRPALIAAMMACLAAPPVQLLEWMLQDWSGTYFLIFCFFAGLEGILSERMLQKRRVVGWAYLGSRAAEVLILLLALKFANYVPLGLDQLWTEARLWLGEPELFVTNLDLFTGLLFLPLWVGALYTARQVAELDAGELRAAPPPDKTSTEYYLWLTQPPIVRERERAIDWLGETFVWGGIALLLASAAIYGLLPGEKLATLPPMLYFALGVALLSQARFGITRIGWSIQGIRVQPGIARRWLLWAVIFLVGVALVARLLPTTYALGPVLAVYGLIGIVAQGFLFVIGLIFYGLALLLSLIFPQMERPEPPSLPPPSSVVLPEQAAETGSPPWLAILLSVLFWVTVLGIAGYALVRFLRDRAGLLGESEGSAGDWWRRFLAWLRDLWLQWRLWQRGVQERIAQRRAQRTAEQALRTGLFRYFSLRRLPPRELVRYFYLSTERRAAQAGRPRRSGQTPYEYETDLDREFPEVETEVSGLTEAFIAARYSRHDVDREAADAVKPLWQRIKAVLRRRRPGPEVAEENERD